MKQAIVLSAGEGLRLRPFTVNKPKAMISVAGKPIIRYVLESLAENGIRDIILIVGYQKEQIFDHIGDGNQLGIKVRYISQDKQLGTAHALAQAQGATDDEFLVLSGNKLISPDTISQFVNAKPTSILVKRVDDPSRYGVVNFKAGNLYKIEENPSHPESNYITTGIYVFNKSIFTVINSELAIPSVINNMLQRGELVNIIETDRTWLDVVYPWDILSLNSILLQKVSPSQNGTVEPGVILRGRVCIGQGTIIHANSYMVGPVLIGKGCEIGPNVCIFPSTSIGDNVIVSPFSIIKNSVVENDIVINPNSTIQDSVIDRGCIIGSHFNACSDESEIKIDDEHHVVKTGVMMGRSCQVGNTVTVQSGTIVGNYSQINSLKLLSGKVPDRSLVF